MDDHGPIGDVVDNYIYDVDGSLDYIELYHRQCALRRGYKIKNDTVVSEAVSPHPKLHFWLVSAVTEYDRKQESKRGYNMYALPQYLGALDRIEDDIRQGASIRSAIEDHFSGPLQTFVLKWLQKQGARLDESQQVGEYPQVNESLPEPHEEEVRRIAGRFQVINCKGKPVGASHPSYSAAQKADQAAKKKHYQE
jgi:hypothetical protein